MAGPLAAARLARLARRAYPLARAAYRRWERLSPEEKERYKRQARQYADRGRSAAGGAAERGRKAVEQARARRSRRR